MKTSTIGRITLNEEHTRLLESALQMGLMSALESLTTDDGSLQDITHLSVVMRELKKCGVSPRDVRSLVVKLRERDSRPLTGHHKEFLEAVNDFGRDLRVLAYRLELDSKQVRRIARQIKDYASSRTRKASLDSIKLPQPR